MAQVLEPILITDDVTSSADEVGFPPTLFVISFDDNRYAATNATTRPPDPMTVDLLAAFTSESDAQAFLDDHGSSLPANGKVQSKPFEEVREIAVAKKNLYGIGLRDKKSILLIHWVR